MTKGDRELILDGYSDQYSRRSTRCIGDKRCFEGRRFEKNFPEIPEYAKCIRDQIETNQIAKNYTKKARISE